MVRLRPVWGKSGDVTSMRTIFCHFALRHYMATRFPDGSKQCHFCGCRVACRGRVGRSGGRASGRGCGVSPKVFVQPPPDPVSTRKPPEGYVLEWAEDDRCRVATPKERAERKCRRHGCTRLDFEVLR